MKRLLCALAAISGPYIAALQEIESGAEAEKIVSQNQLTVVKFYTPWCGPCKKLKPVFEEIAQMYADKAAFLSVDVTKQENDEYFSRYGRGGVPHISFLGSDGKEIDSIDGASGNPDSDRRILEGRLNKVLSGMQPAQPTPSEQPKIDIKKEAPAPAKPTSTLLSSIAQAERALIFVHTSECPYCKKQKPALDNVIRSYPSAFIVVEAELNNLNAKDPLAYQELVKHANDGVPVILFAEKGVIKERLLGFQPEQELDIALTKWVGKKAPAAIKQEQIAPAPIISEKNEKRNVQNTKKTTKQEKVKAAKKENTQQPSPARRGRRSTCSTGTCGAGKKRR